jgi:hypothetical protein
MKPKGLQQMHKRVCNKLDVLLPTLLYSGARTMEAKRTQHLIYK